MDANKPTANEGRQSPDFQVIGEKPHIRYAKPKKFCVGDKVTVNSNGSTSGPYTIASVTTAGYTLCVSDSDATPVSDGAEFDESVLIAC